jgi:tetratricopeptide (TPR) repeat protein
MPTKKATPQRKAHRADESFHVAERLYASAMTFFTRQNWAKARDAFQVFLKEYANDREIPDIADRARTHLRTCEQRLSAPPSPPSSADGWLLEGVGLANEGRTDEAIAAFEKALAGGANATHVHYARAAALAIADRQEEALEHLALAIEADPGTRFQSLTDPDFERLRETAGYVSLVEPPDEYDEDDLDDEDDDDEEEEDVLDDLDDQRQ